MPLPRIASCSIGLLMLAACSAHAAAPVTARAAYQAKDWATCATLYTQHAELPVPRLGSGYNAACCLAMAGDLDAAFARLQQLPEHDPPDLEHMAADADLAPLRDDPRWQPLLVTLKARQDAREAAYDKPLRRELAIRVNRDQDLRRRYAQDFDNTALSRELDEVDRDNLAWLRSVVERQGWPTISQVGSDGAGSFWLLAQHADADPAFQVRVLELMEQAVARNEAFGYQLAYLTDRVLVTQEQPQRFGTQLQIDDGRILPPVLEDADAVDARRAAVGLGPLADYIAANQANLDSR